jgi:hypothetical protein
LDTDPTAQPPYLVTEYVDGPELAEQVSGWLPMQRWDTPAFGTSAFAADGAASTCDCRTRLQRVARASNTLPGRIKREPLVTIQVL